jgi:hypothetical protein
MSENDVLLAYFPMVCVLISASRYSPALEDACLEGALVLYHNYNLCCLPLSGNHFCPSMVDCSALQQSLYHVRLFRHVFHVFHFVVLRFKFTAGHSLARLSRGSEW